MSGQSDTRVQTSTKSFKLQASRYRFHWRESLRHNQKLGGVGECKPYPEKLAPSWLFTSLAAGDNASIFDVKMYALQSRCPSLFRAIPAMPVVRSASASGLLSTAQHIATPAVLAGIVCAWIGVGISYFSFTECTLHWFDQIQFFKSLQWFSFSVSFSKPGSRNC